MDKRRLGFFYSLMALFFLILYPLFSKLGFSYFNFQTTAVLWFGTAALFSFFMILFSGRIKRYSSFKTHWRYILLGGFLNTIGMLLSWYVLDALNPGIHSFLSKTSVIFMIFGGVMFLREKYSYREGISAFIVITGVLLLSYKQGSAYMKSIVLIILCNILFTVYQMIYKAKLKRVEPLFMVNYRATIIALFTLAFTLVTGSLKIILSMGLLYSTLPAILSAVFAHLFIFRAYKLIEMSKVELTLAMQPFLVLALSHFIFREILTPLQFAGGGIIVIGAISLIYSKKLTEKVSS